MDGYPALRAALAATTETHFAVLRQIAPAVDPRTAAAESVAATATALIGLPILWQTAELLAAIIDHQDDAARLIRTLALPPREITRLLHRLDALSQCTKAWTQEAYRR